MTDPAERPFVVWDGEGISRQPRHPQDYVLYGCYNGNDHQYLIDKALTTKQCLDFMLDQSELNPGAFHVAFAFNYDVNMILNSLSARSLERLKNNGHVWWRDYRIEHLSSKWFRVSQNGRSITIYDTWSFFQSSLVKALKSYIPNHPLMQHLPEIEAGKAQRGSFTDDDMQEIERYWKMENMLFHLLVSQLREYLYSVDLRITKWHGPGALANYTFKSKGIRQHQSDCGSLVYDASRYAYSSGRFEHFGTGRYLDVYSIDRNSAYPFAISQLPSLTEGYWARTNELPERLEKFALYHIVLHGSPLEKQPGPLFHRDSRGNISFPWNLKGWYWAPEIQVLRDAQIPFDFIEGWEYKGWSSQPFAFVTDMYEQRRMMKLNGQGAQMALKLCLNALYGKMAQRAGWERNGQAPPWHQLEWAGWVTSFTRAAMYRAMMKIPWRYLIAIETDGIYASIAPDKIGIHSSDGFGEWEVKHYDEMVYLQSGVYAQLHDDGKWTCKYRGLDADSLSAQQIVEHAHLLLPNQEWPPIVGTTTRFVGYKQALFRQAQNRGPMKVHHRRWETDKKEISCGNEGKRIHVPKLCVACAANLSAYDAPHTLVIRPVVELQSSPHDIPWLDKDRAVWREIEESEDRIWED